MDRHVRYDKYSITEFSRKLSGCEGVIYDLDNTLVAGRISEGVGRQFLLDEAKGLHLRHALSGLANYRKVLKLARENEADGLKLFVDVIAATGCMTGQMFLEYAENFVKDNMLPGAYDFARKACGKRNFISTIGPDLGAIAASKYFSAVDVAANRVVVEFGKVSGVEIVVRSGRDKLRATEEMVGRRGLRLSQCLFVGDDRYDHDTMLAAKLSAASPLADDETKRIADFWIKDYQLLKTARF